MATPEEIVDQEWMVKIVNQSLLTKLTPREERVIRLRFGMYPGEPLTLEAVGKQYGVSRERIRSIEQKALRKLKRPEVSRSLRAALEIASPMGDGNTRGGPSHYPSPFREEKPTKSVTTSVPSTPKLVSSFTNDELLLAAEQYRRRAKINRAYAAWVPNPQERNDYARYADRDDWWAEQMLFQVTALAPDQLDRWLSIFKGEK